MNNQQWVLYNLHDFFKLIIEFLTFDAVDSVKCIETQILFSYHQKWGFVINQALSPMHPYVLNLLDNFCVFFLIIAYYECLLIVQVCIGEFR